MPGLKPGDCSRLFAPYDYFPLGFMFFLGPGIRSGFLPLTRPSVLGNPLRIMEHGQIQPPCLRTLKNGAEVPQITSRGRRRVLG